MLEKLPQGLGHALIRQRAGMDKLVCQHWPAGKELAPLTLTSTAFADNGRLPIACTADGKGLSPPLGWEHLPAGAASMALIVEDADSPTPRPLVHAIVIGLSAEVSSLPEGALNGADHPGLRLAMGRNSYFKRAWLAPDPPPGHGPHRYVFQAFALRASEKGHPENPGRREFVNVVMDRAIGRGVLIGTYERSA